MVSSIYLLAQNGFLPTRGSFMLDFVVVAMFAVLAIMSISIGLARFRQQYQLHKLIQLVLGIVLLVTIVAFEVDLRFITKNWRELAEPSPYLANGWVDRLLWLHLCFAIPTPLLWAWVIVQAMRKFDCPPKPNAYSPRHKLLARIAALLMIATAFTGWAFYAVAFVM